MTSARWLLPEALVDLGSHTGAGGGTRTHDRLLRRQLLYPLSYARMQAHYTMWYSGKLVAQER